MSDANRVRPFAITGGRTRSDHIDLAMETMVVVSGAPIIDLRHEAARVHAACEQPVAVAEVAARAGLVVGVTRVLVGDLVESGALQLCGRAVVTVDRSLLGRVLQGLEAL